MIKGIFSILLFIFVLLVLLIMLTGGYLLRTFRNMKKAAEQMAEQQARQHRDETGRQRQQYGQRQQTGSTQSANSRAQEQQPQEEARYTQTATGETIIDHRHQERENKKIFDDSDGEYVEYEEA